MRVAIPFKYTALEVPPRCRKAREVGKDFFLPLSIAEITADQAPVAFIEHGDHLGAKFTREYRWYGGCLWLTPIYNNVPEIQTAEQFLKSPQYLLSVVRPYSSLKENEEALFETASHIIFIDGVRWERTLEPEYRIRASVNWISLDVVFGEKHELGDPAYYRVDQLEDALDWVEKAYRDKVERFSRFEVLIPDALRLPATPKREKFSVSVTLQVEGCGPQGAVREFVSDLGISDYNARRLFFSVSNLQTGEATTVQLPPK